MSGVLSLQSIVYKTHLMTENRRRTRTVSRGGAPLCRVTCLDSPLSCLVSCEMRCVRALRGRGAARPPERHTGLLTLCAVTVADGRRATRRPIAKNKYDTPPIRAASRDPDRVENPTPTATAHRRPPIRSVRGAAHRRRLASGFGGECNAGRVMTRVRPAVASGARFSCSWAAALSTAASAAAIGAQLSLDHPCPRLFVAALITVFTSGPRRGPPGRGAARASIRSAPSPPSSASSRAPQSRPPRRGQRRC